MLSLNNSQNFDNINNNTLQLYFYFIKDVYTSFHTFFANFLYLLNCSGKDFFSPIIFHNPVIILGIQDYALFNLSQDTIILKAAYIFNTYLSNLSISEYYTIYILYFLSLSLFVFIFITIAINVSSVI
jgi:hypothetical protein